MAALAYSHVNGRTQGISSAPPLPTAGGGRLNAQPQQQGVGYRATRASKLANGSGDKEDEKEMRELECDTERVLSKYGYFLGTSIGEGTYAKVRKAQFIATDKQTGQYKTERLAVKCIYTKKAPRDFVSKFLPREIDILSKLEHVHVVRTRSIFQVGSHMYCIFMELCEKGDLLDEVRKHGALEQQRAKRLFYQLSSAVKYLHERNIVHRDLKCENLLLDINDNLKVGDFGFSRFATDESGRRVLSRTYCGSAAYAAPEILQGIPYNPKMYDVWSMGVILYTMVCGTMPFDDSNLSRMLKQQLKHDVRYPSKARERVPEACKFLVRHMLHPDVTRRATVEHVNKSEWLTL